jgi:hypothetical protein
MNHEAIFTPDALASPEGNSGELGTLTLTMDPGASVAETAWAHGVNANQIVRRQLFIPVDDNYFIPMNDNCWLNC